MRLLHPFIPFITEEIWQKLPKRAGEAATVTLAAFPTAVAEWSDPGAERDVRYLQEVVSTIRTVRSERSIPPSRKIAAIVDEAHAGAGAMLVQYAAYLKQLAGLETLEFKRHAAPAADTVKRVLEHAHIYVPLAGIGDRKDEIEKLQKELAGIDREGASLAQKLGTAGFVERAPAAVVDEARARAAQLAERRQKLQTMLTELGV
jgi:valyl-tRNA synthetase